MKKVLQNYCCPYCTTICEVESDCPSEEDTEEGQYLADGDEINCLLCKFKAAVKVKATGDITFVEKK
jgi:hypothetical protein